MKVDDDSPTHVRNSRNNNDDENKKNGRPERKRRRTTQASHRIAPLGGDVPLCLRKNVKDRNDDSSSKGKKHEEEKSGSSTQSKTKHCVMNKTASGSKDICPRSTEEKHDLQKKNMRSMHASEKSKNWLPNSRDTDGTGFY